MKNIGEPDQHSESAASPPRTVAPGGKFTSPRIASNLRESVFSLHQADACCPRLPSSRHAHARTALWRAHISSLRTTGHLREGSNIVIPLGCSRFGLVYAILTLGIAAVSPWFGARVLFSTLGPRRTLCCSNPVFNRVKNVPLAWYCSVHLQDIAER